MKIIRYTFLLFAGFMASCSLFDNDPDSVEVRIQNKSSVAFDSVHVVFWNEAFQYGRLEPLEISDYKEPERAYRYAYIRVVIDNASYVLQPIDYVGETPLKNGRYTYIVDVLEPNDPYSVTLELKRD